MNYDDIVSAINHGEKIYNLPLRVTYYCRVSTDSENQLNSLDNQQIYYEEYIKSKPSWTFIKGYIENGVTGVSVNKRKEFKKMINDAQDNKFDLIITKEVSRFARDLEDSIHYIRVLKSSNVGVFFENQNLNTFDSNSELILNIMFNIAQEESKKLSSRIKFGHHQAIENGHVLGSSNITGYRKEKCKLVIVPEEAKLIQTIFELYATGEYGLYKLSSKLASLGYHNKNGRLYDKDTLKKIISNPKYKGFYRGHTFEIMDYRTKRRKKIPIDNQVIYRCHDGSIPAIISEELWNKANNILESRSKNYQNNNHWSGGLKYAFSSKIYCHEHNIAFQRSHGRSKQKRPTWCCGLYLTRGIESCLSPILIESDLITIIKNIINSIILQDNSILNSMLDMYNNINTDSTYNDEINDIEESIKTIENKKNLALDLVLNGYLKKEDLASQFTSYEKEINNLTITKTNLLKEKSKNQTKDLTNYIQEELNGGMVEEFTRTFVDEIIVSKIDGDRNNILLDIYLDFSDNEKIKCNGARHINGPLDNEILYLKGQNKYAYNVYIW